MQTLGALAGLAAGTIVPGAVPAAQAEGIAIHSVGLNSATLPAHGALFAALPGTRTHGASFVADLSPAAIITDPAGLDIIQQQLGEQHPPVLVVPVVREVLGPVSAAIYDNPSAQMTVIGVTGTSGKTTTTYLLEAALLAAGHRVGIIGTTGTRIMGEPVATELTTPEAPTLQALFAQMLAAGVTHVVMEVSSHAIALGRIAGTQFAVRAFTNLSQDHLDFHPDLEDYFRTKAELFGSRFGETAASVVCINDEWGTRLAADLGLRAVTVATSGQPADLYIADQKVHPDGTQEATVHVGAKTYPLSLQLPGAFNLANAAVALACGLSLGEDLSVLTAGLAATTVPGRMEKISAGQDFLAVVDYAHKPEAVRQVLQTVRRQTSGRVGIVLGAGGDRDQSKRPLMGEAAGELADLVIVTDDNPRSEDPATIRAAVLAGVTSVTSSREVDVREIGDRSAAIAAAVAWAQPGDAVIIAGKGHETGQKIGDQVLHFDDREELRREVAAKQAAQQS